MNHQDTIERDAPVVPYWPETWDDPARQSVLKAYRREMPYSTSFCTVIKNMESQPSFAIYTVEDDEICEGIVSDMIEAGEVLKTDTLHMMWVGLDTNFIIENAYHQQFIIDPENATNPSCAIDVTDGINDRKDIMEMVVAIVGIGSEQDSDGNMPCFILHAQADYGDGEGFLSVIKTVYDEYGNGMFEKSEQVVVCRVRVTIDDALKMGDNLHTLFPVVDDGDEVEPFSAAV